MQQQTIRDVLARDHIDDLRRRARLARLAKVRRRAVRSTHRSR
jgi:hypothetical protein